MTTHGYPRSSVIEDVALLLAIGGTTWLLPRGGFATWLLAGVVIVFGWGAVTLHFPERVEIDDEGIAFFRYGRAHRFAWRDVTRVKVRRFLVRDRVFVGLSPAPAWRGKYWIMDSIDGFEGLVGALEGRMKGGTEGVEGGEEAKKGG